MKSITNDCLQRLELYLTTQKGAKRVWLSPRETMVVPTHFISGQIKTLSTRRMLSVRNA
jgi:hypothetical protein